MQVAMFQPPDPNRPKLDAKRLESWRDKNNYPAKRFRYGNDEPAAEASPTAETADATEEATAAEVEDLN